MTEGTTPHRAIKLFAKLLLIPRKVTLNRLVRRDLMIGFELQHTNTHTCDGCRVYEKYSEIDARISSKNVENYSFANGISMGNILNARNKLF